MTPYTPVKLTRALVDLDGEILVSGGTLGIVKALLGRDAVVVFPEGAFTVAQDDLASDLSQPDMPTSLHDGLTQARLKLAAAESAYKATTAYEDFQRDQDHFRTSKGLLEGTDAYRRLETVKQEADTWKRGLAETVGRIKREHPELPTATFPGVHRITEVTTYEVTDERTALTELLPLALVGMGVLKVDTERLGKLIDLGVLKLDALPWLKEVKDYKVAVNGGGGDE